MGDLLKGKVAIVTGAGRGIGRAHAIALARQGAKVVVNDYGVAKNGTGSNDKSVADRTVAEIKSKGYEAVANYDSVAESNGAAHIIKTALDTFGRLDILVNNAGIIKRQMVFDITDEDWDRMIKVHLYGHFYCAREAAKVFRQQHSGRIINTSSIAGLGNSGRCNYAAAKEGIVGLTRALAVELGNDGVTVNCIRPSAYTGLEEPEPLEAMTGLGKGEAERRRTDMLTRTPEGVTALVVFLSSDYADNVNGCVFNVSSGQVSIYRDPPNIEGTVWKSGNFTPEELVELLPKSLTLGKTRELPKQEIWPPL
jgi:NAD(P)-dependent dehydrogenase (short-subunit alcohol dehydrogenase family)